jgi:hypothetical protein
MVEDATLYGSRYLPQSVAFSEGYPFSIEPSYPEKEVKCSCPAHSPSSSNRKVVEAELVS